MDGYTKLHARILTSSIWNEPNHVRILFITLLALADSNGRFEGSPAGLAALARLTVDEAVDALRVLEGPDPHSSDGTTGERLLRLSPGVWEIINHRHYRDKKTRKQIADLERQRKTRKAPKEDATCSNVTPCHTASVYVSDAESTSTLDGTEADAPARTPRTRSEPLRGFDAFWDAYGKKVGLRASQAAWKRIQPDDALAAEITAKAAAVAAAKEKQFRKDPERWLKGRHWEDEIVEPSRSAHARTGKVTDCLWDGSTADPNFYRGPGNESVWGDERDD